MEPTTPGNPTGETQDKGHSVTSTPAGQAARAAGGSGAQQTLDQPTLTNRSTEIVDLTKQTVTDAYDKTSQAVSEAYDKTSKTINTSYQQAMDYGRENPGTFALIAVGAGIGIGLLLAGSFSSRSRASRVLPPVMGALSKIVTNLFR